MMFFSWPIELLFLVLLLPLLFLDKIAALQESARLKKQARSNDPEDSPLPDPGRFGRVRTPLRPVGKVVISGTTYQARSRDGILDAGAEVIVVGADTGELIVQARTATPVDQPET